MGLPGAPNSRNSRATAQKLNQTRIYQNNLFKQSVSITAQYRRAAVSRSPRQCQKRSFVKQSQGSVGTRKGCDKSTDPKSSRKCMFERHSERNCRKKHKTPVPGTYKCMKACIIVDLHYTLNYADCRKQIWKSAYYSCLKVGTSWGNKFKK